MPATNRQGGQRGSSRTLCDPEEPGPLSFGDKERVKRILFEAGFSGIKIEGLSTPFIVGKNFDNAARFLTQMGPASGAIKNVETDEETKLRIASDMRDALAAYETEQGVALGSATWIVTARNPSVVG